VQFCSRCAEYCQASKFTPKACIYFNAYSYFKPETVRNLFIAEAPPQTEPRYFYNTEIPAGSLRKGLFKQLGIKDYSARTYPLRCQGYFPEGENIDGMEVEGGEKYG